MNKYILKIHLPENFDEDLLITKSLAFPNPVHIGDFVYLKKLPIGIITNIEHYFDDLSESVSTVYINGEESTALKDKDNFGPFGPLEDLIDRFSN